MERNQGHYHLHYRKFTRSDGKSAVEAAAYRLGARLHDERTGLTHDYTAKRGVTQSILIGPTGQNVPVWARDPAKLWNEVEASEKNNPRSLVMHELEIALPSELTPDQRRTAALEMAQFVADRYGAMAHLAFHDPNREGDQRNYHVHLMFTPRAITEDGFSKKKFRHFSRREQEAQREGELTGAEEIKFIREQWAHIGNRHLERAGHPPNLDHRSYEDQGLDLEPQKHLGPEATAKERRGEHTAKGDFNRAAEDRNKRRQAWAKAWEQAKIDITDAKLPEPPPRPPMPFPDKAPPQEHHNPPAPFSGAFEALMENQKTERRALIQLHMTEKKALWRRQQEIRQTTQKKAWADLYRRHRQEREALNAKPQSWFRRLLHNLDITGTFKKREENSLEALNRRQKTERTEMGRRHKDVLQQQTRKLEAKHLKELGGTDDRYIAHLLKPLRTEQKRQWAQLYRQQKQERDALEAMSKRIISQMEDSKEKKAARQKAEEALDSLQRQQKIERAEVGRQYKKTLRQEFRQLEKKHLNDMAGIDKTHIAQRQEFLERQAHNERMAARMQSGTRSRDKDQERGRER